MSDLATVAEAREALKQIAFMGFGHNSVLGRLANAVIALSEEKKKLCKTLEWYAERGHYAAVSNGLRSVVDGDGGARARGALEK